jgi:vacuolar-type H+-ATPase subunit I/STV1
LQTSANRNEGEKVILDAVSKTIDELLSTIYAIHAERSRENLAPEIPEQLARIEKRLDELTERLRKKD